MFHAVLLTIIWISFGMWGVRKLLRGNLIAPNRRMLAQASFLMGHRTGSRRI